MLFVVTAFLPFVSSNKNSEFDDVIIFIVTVQQGLDCAIGKKYLIVEWLIFLVWIKYGRKIIIAPILKVFLWLAW